jgi:hypothetical protein
MTSSGCDTGLIAFNREPTELQRQIPVDGDEVDGGRDELPVCSLNRVVEAARGGVAVMSRRREPREMPA